MKPSCKCSTMNIQTQTSTHAQRRKIETSFGEWTWDLWVPFNSLAFLSYSFASTETIRRKRFLLKRNMSETPCILKYSAISSWCCINPCIKVQILWLCDILDPYKIKTITYRTEVKTNMLDIEYVQKNKCIILPGWLWIGLFLNNYDLGEKEKTNIGNHMN